MREATEALRQLATTDGLTTLMNRRSFDSTLNNEVLRARRDKAPISLLLVDVDRFKAYNDLYGHQAGDEVLRRVGACLKDVLKRPGDVAARYGGEEFAIILPGTDEDGAFFIADKFCAELRGLGIEHKGGDRGVVTASVGIATFAGGETTEGGAVLLRRADTALYDAKHAGRDRIMGFRPRDELRRRA
jgi:diguanylate cyclase (GGDEF)-like protein